MDKITGILIFLLFMGLLLNSYFDIKDEKDNLEIDCLNTKAWIKHLTDHGSYNMSRLKLDCENGVFLRVGK